MIKALLPLAALLFLGACSGGKSSEEAVEFFPVHSYLRSQVSHIDSSLYPLRQIVRRGTFTDTTFMHRNQFRSAAADFLAVPDIASDKWRDEYTETRHYDDMLKLAVFSYKPKDEDGPVLQQDVTIEPNATEGDAVHTIFINQIVDKKDSTVQKKMLWEVGRRFQIVTTVSRNGAADEVQTVEVWWGPYASAE
jgi:hypothetical protein